MTNFFSVIIVFMLSIMVAACNPFFGEDTLVATNKSVEQDLNLDNSNEKKIIEEGFEDSENIKKVVKNNPKSKNEDEKNMKEEKKEQDGFYCSKWG